MTRAEHEAELYAAAHRAGPDRDEPGEGRRPAEARQPRLTRPKAPRQLPPDDLFDDRF